MMEETKSDTLSLVTESLIAIPDPIQNTFIKSLSRLIGGLMSIPAAKLAQYSQGIEDTTTAKSSVSAAMAKVAIEAAGRDPLVMQAAAEVLLPDSVRKVKNRLAVAQSAAEHLANEGVAGSGTDEGRAAAPDDDWMNNFIRGAEDASSDRLRDLFGRILAGEILRPGAFGPRTLRAVSELNQNVAADFAYAWSKSVGNEVDYSPEWQRGDGYLRWMRLSEAGLMAISPSARYLSPFKPVVGDLSIWIPMTTGTVFTSVIHRKDYSATWDHIPFTQTGREIGSLLDEPDFAGNMTAAAERLPKEHAVEIHLNLPGDVVRLIWPTR